MRTLRDPADRSGHEGRQRQGESGGESRLGQADHSHGPEHDKLALGEVDDAGSVVDDPETESDERIDAAAGHTGDEKLWELSPEHES
jgi:hypothetical protein